jgi:hypothetical protein
MPLEGRDHADAERGHDVRARHVHDLLSARRCEQADAGEKGHGDGGESHPRSLAERGALEDEAENQTRHRGYPRQRLRNNAVSWSTNGVATGTRVSPARAISGDPGGLASVREASSSASNPPHAAATTAAHSASRRISGSRNFVFTGERQPPCGRAHKRAVVTRRALVSKGHITGRAGGSVTTVFGNSLRSSA